MNLRTRIEDSLFGFEFIDKRTILEWNLYTHFEWTMGLLFQLTHPLTNIDEDNLSAFDNISKPEWMYPGKRRSTMHSLCCYHSYWKLWLAADQCRTGYVPIAAWTKPLPSGDEKNKLFGTVLHCFSSEDDKPSAQCRKSQLAFDWGDWAIPPVDDPTWMYANCGTRDPILSFVENLSVRNFMQWFENYWNKIVTTELGTRLVLKIEE